MEEDEESTIRTLTAYRDLMSVLIQKHKGHVVDSPGDNLLAEFESLTDAVHCAVEIQEELRIRNAELPENRKMRFRIGINLGEIIEDKDRIYGDGVNVAARVEGLADGGGICISGAVYDAIKNKLSMSYEFMGEYNVKNIKEPVRIYRIRVEPEAESAIKKEKKAGLRRWQWAAMSVAAIVILGVVTYIVFDKFYFVRQSAENPQVPAVGEAVRTKKTVAVLPFINMSPDPDQEYFAGGLSDELLNSLAQIPDLRVIARTSSFAFKGKDKTVQEIAGALGADYILEGSVRKDGNALRIIAQLIQAVDSIHLWSNTFDRELNDIFDIQEDIATAVANELKVTLGIGESLKQLGGTDNVEAYELYLTSQGMWSLDVNSQSDALKLIDAVITLEPNFAQAWETKAYYTYRRAQVMHADQSISELEKALQAAQKAIELEPNLANAYGTLGAIRSSRGEFVEAGLAFLKASELTTGSLGTIAEYINHLCDVGYFEKAHELNEEIRRSDPLNENNNIGKIELLSYLSDMHSAEEAYKDAKAIHGDDCFICNLFITMARLGSGQAVSRDDILISHPIHDAAKEHLETPKDGLAELARLYTDGDYQDSASQTIIASWAAYFDGPEFSLDAIEKAVSVDAGNINNYWTPLFHEVRQLPRFKELVRKIGIVDYWEQFGWPDICHQLDNGDFECD